jgi:hypothetical protein
VVIDSAEDGWLKKGMSVLRRESIRSVYRTILTHNSLLKHLIDLVSFMLVKIYC